MEAMNISTYQEFRQAFGDEVKKQSEGFIRIGYLLKRARDTDILAGSGYRTIAEFAWAEYHFTEDVVSRMININDRYSVGGYSDQLQEKYRVYGMSLLAEMLTLPEEVVDALPPGTTRQEIRQIKAEIREESKITDLEVLMEGEKPELKAFEGKLEKFFYQYFHENRTGYGGIYRAVNGGPDKEGQVFNELAPSGIATFITRIQGMGKYMLSVKGRESSLELLNIRDNSKDTFTWGECVSVLAKLCPEGRRPEESWEGLYGVPFLEQAEETVPITSGIKPESKLGIKGGQESRPGSKVESKPEVEAKSEIGPAPEVEAKPEMETKPDAESMTEVEQRPGAEAKPVPEPKSETKAEIAPAQPAAGSEQRPELPLSVDGEENTGNHIPEPKEAEKPLAEESNQLKHEGETDQLKRKIAPAQVKHGEDMREQVPENFHQTDIEDFDEVLPEGYIKCHDGSEVSKGRIQTRYEALAMAESISEMAEILSQADDRNWFEWLEGQCER